MRTVKDVVDCANAHADFCKHIQLDVFVFSRNQIRYTLIHVKKDLLIRKNYRCQGHVVCLGTCIRFHVNEPNNF